MSTECAVPLLRFPSGGGSDDIVLKRGIGTSDDMFFIPEQPPALRVPGRYFLHLLTRLEVTVQANLFASVVTPMSRQLS
jgi:hypothetical protein